MCIGDLAVGGREQPFNRGHLWESQTFKQRVLRMLTPGTHFVYIRDPCLAVPPLWPGQTTCRDNNARASLRGKEGAGRRG